MGAVLRDKVPGTVRRLFQFSTRHPRLVACLYLLVALVCGGGWVRLEAEDDVFVFLPEGDPDVGAFHEVSDRFGSLRVALLGVSVDEGSVVDAPVVRALQTATRRLGEVEGVTRVLSLVNTTDVVSGPAGAVVELLVPGPPQDETALAELRARVSARDLIVGNLVSRDLRSTVLFVYFDARRASTPIVHAVRDVANETLAGYRLHYGGAPFAADSIYSQTRTDVERLAPVAGIVLVLVVLLSFRDVVGVLLTFSTVAFSTVCVLGLMGFAAERYTLLTSTLPIILLATGSSYPVHVLGRYYLERERHDPSDALRRTAEIVTQPVSAAAMTTICAFSSFLVMDVAPMRTFGIEVALGTALCWLCATTLVPAVLTLVPRGPEREQLMPFGNVLTFGWTFAARRKPWILGGALVVAAASILPLPGVRARMDPQAFFTKGSDAALAHRFFEAEFGGARFLQLETEGDFTDPRVLRRLARITEALRAVPGVTQVTSAIDPILFTMNVLGGATQLPSTLKQAQQVYLFLDGQPEFGDLMRPDHRHTLLVARIHGDGEPVLAAVEETLRAVESSPPGTGPNTLAAEVLDVVRSGGSGVALEVLEPIVGALSSAPYAPTNAPPNAEAAVASIRAFLTSEDASDISPEDRAAITNLVAQGKTPTEALRGALRPDDADFYVEIAGRFLAEAEVTAKRDAILTRTLAAAELPSDDPRLVRTLRRIFGDAVTPLPDAPAPEAMTLTVTGEPVLDRALSRSVRRNQLRSMAVGLVIVSLVLLALYRSFVLAAICTAPAFLTAALLGGIMGAFEIEIDLSTAMVGAILTDTASDFGMHYLWYLQRRPPEVVIRTVGPVLLVSTLLVALGFFVFALGESPVMQLFGVLSGATCILSALFATLLVPTAFTSLHPRERVTPVDDD